MRRERMDVAGPMVDVEWQAFERNSPFLQVFVLVVEYRWTDRIEIDEIRFLRHEPQPVFLVGHLAREERDRDPRFAI
jgi:hypothetical protein